jgi:hypothetical protein
MLDVNLTIHLCLVRLRVVKLYFTFYLKAGIVRGVYKQNLQSKPHKQPVIVED